MNNTIKQIKQVGIYLSSFTIGVLGHLIGGKVLDRHKIQQNIKAEEARDQELLTIKNELTNLNSKINHQSVLISQNTEKLDDIINTTYTSEEVGVLDKKLNTIDEELNIGRQSIDEGKNLYIKATNEDNSEMQDAILRSAKENLDKGLNKIDMVSNKIQEILNSNQKFMSEMDSIYEYLDSLTLLEESALFNILCLCTIFLISTNFLSVFFGNEIINYFKLEEKLP